MKMEVVILLVGVSLIIDLGFLPCSTSARTLEFTGRCLEPKEGDTVELKEVPFTPWAAAELKFLNNQRLEVLKYDDREEIIHNPKISRYAGWLLDRLCENIKRHYEVPYSQGNYQFELNEYWPRINSSIGYTMTGCNYDLIHHYGNGTLGDVDRVLKFYASYKNHEVNYAGLRCGSSLFLPFIKEIGFAERYCSHVRAVTIMSWPPILDQNFNPADLIPKCILDNDEKSVKSDVLGSSHAWRLRFLDRVNQHRSTESMSNVLLNIELCKSVQWTLLQLKNKPDLNVKTTQEVIDATGKKNWTVQCADTQLGLSAKSDSNSELNAVHLVDNIKVNRTDKAYRNLFSESAMEICATYEVIDKPKDPHGEGLWMIGIQVSFITKADSKGTKFDSKGTKIDSKGTKVDPKGTKNGKKRTKGSLGGGTTPIPDYSVEDSARSGVGSDIHKLWMISSFGVITLQFFFIFF